MNDELKAQIIELIKENLTIDVKNCTAFYEPDYKELYLKFDGEVISTIYLD